jgi:CBS domain containing-hemolysin-like protein
VNLYLTIAILLLAEGFFSGSEIAVISANRLHLKTRASQGDRGSALALKMLERPEFLLGSCLIGTNLSVVATSTVATIGLAHKFGTGGELFVAIILFPVVLLFGELIPKTVYRRHADAIVPIIIFPLWLFSILLTPVLTALEWFTDTLKETFGDTSSDKDATSRSDIQALFRSSAIEIDDDDRSIINKLFELSEATVEEVMVPLIDIKAIEASEPLSVALDQFLTHGHSWLPLFSERVDRITGIIHHSDLTFVENLNQLTSSIQREVRFVPESKPVDDLFREFRRESQRIAIVVDEYGGTVGLITAEDILEEIVGEINDEHDAEGSQVRKVGPTEWVVNARIEEEVLRDTTGLQLPEGDFETLAGFILTKLGHIPCVGERVVESGWVYEVHKANDRAILEVKLHHKGQNQGK